METEFVDSPELAKVILMPYLQLKSNLEINPMLIYSLEGKKKHSSIVFHPSNLYKFEG